jgi:hypothetical protein
LSTYCSSQVQTANISAIFWLKYFKHYYIGVVFVAVDAGRPEYDGLIDALHLGKVDDLDDEADGFLLDFNATVGHLFFRQL